MTETANLAAMSAPIPVVINRSGGTASSMGDGLGPTVEAAFAAVGCPIDLHLVDGQDMGDTIGRLAAAHPAVVVGGGDGSLGGAAQTLADANRTLGILPLGTRNHLAKQLGIPADLDGAARVIAAGRTTRIDLAHIAAEGDDARSFVNNAAIGTYPRLVRERDDSALPKWLATIPAAWSVLRRNDHQRLSLSWPGGGREIYTPMLFVGNNRYCLDGPSKGERESISDGVLSVYAVAPRGRRALIAFALRTLVGHADPMHDFDALIDVVELTVHGGGGSVDVATDGEVARIALPLTFSLDPRALSVFVDTVDAGDTPPG